MRSVKIDLTSGDGVMIHSDEKRLILQIRRLVHDKDEPLACSFKVAVELDAASALRVASELLGAASALVKLGHCNSPDTVRSDGEP